MSTPRIIVIGAGITGLSLAVTLREEARRIGARIDLVVLERDRTAGGHARTLRQDGFAIEAGPNGFLNREPETLALVDELNLKKRLITANPAAARRFIVRDGRLCRVPDSPLTLVTTPALSWRGKARMVAEPWAPAPPGGDETVYDFAARRVGREAAEILVDTAVSGISAGDSRQLSVAAQFPVLVEMEQQHGGLLRAMLKKKRSPLGPPRLLSFDEGMGVLSSTMATTLGGALVTRAVVETVERQGRTWRVRMNDGCWLEGDHVVMATPARGAARVLESQAPELAAALREVTYAGIAVAALGFRAADVPRALDGYGYLVTRREGLSTLGVVWESSLFAGRAADGYVLLRAMLGGSRVPGVADGSEDAIVDLARRELQQVMGITAEPTLAQAFRWPGAIAQYTLGHRDRVTRMRQLVQAQPGLAICGTSYDGVSFNHAVKSGRETARRLAGMLWRGRQPEISPLELATA